MDSYLTIAGTAQGIYEEKKSKFIATLAHVETEDAALEVLDAVRTQHAMARHNVYAYVLRADNRVRYSDDGEPSKTAGIPVLDVLQHERLFDLICVVTRYFGGTLLGTGGLVRAYTKATQNAVAVAHKHMFALCVDVSLGVEYPLYEKVSYAVEQAGYEVVDTQFTDAVKLTVRVLASEAEALTDAMRQLTNGRISIDQTAPAFCPLSV